MNLETVVTIHEPGTLQNIASGSVTSSGTNIRIDSDGGYTEVAPGVRIHNAPPPNGTTMVIHNVVPIAMALGATPAGETTMVIHEPVKVAAAVSSVEPMPTRMTAKRPKKTPKRAPKKATKKASKKRIR